MARQRASRVWRAPAALLLALSWGGAWVGCNQLAGIEEGVLATGDAGESGTVEAAPPEAASDAEGGGQDAGGEGATGPDFALSLQAPIVGVVRGSTGTVGVTIAPANGFMGAVAITVSGLPAGITADPLTIAAGATSGTLTLHAPSGATLGDGPTLTVTGKSAALAHTANLALLVQDAPGTLDTTFGNQGLESDGIDLFAAYGGMALQPDGKLLVCGMIDKVPRMAFLRRFNVDGTPDTGFGTSMVDGGAPVVTVASPTAGVDAACTALTVLPTGTIAFTGWAQDANQDPNIWVVELKSDGSLNTAFGTGGVAFASSNLARAGTGGTSILGDSSGNLVVAGSFAYGNVGNRPVLARFQASGAIDASFGGGSAGYVLGTYPSATTFSAIASGSSGELLPSMIAPAIAVERFSPAGELDSTFYNQGTATASVGVGDANANAVAMQSDGATIVAGSGIGSMGADGSSTSEIAVARFLGTGHLDTSFGTAGVVGVELGSGNSWVNGVAVDPWGRIVLAGHIETPGTMAFGFGVGRLSASGALDTEFAGGQGFVSTQAGYGSEAVSVLTLPDGRIVAGGATGRWGPFGIACPSPAPDGARYPCNTQSLVLARYWP